jgi:hypothetical protein
MNDKVSMYTKEQAYQCVLDAVNAALSQGRPFADHWFYYMNVEEKVAFAPAAGEYAKGYQAFLRECEERYQLML